MAITVSIRRAYLCFTEKKIHDLQLSLRMIIDASHVLNSHLDIGNSFAVKLFITHLLNENAIYSKKYFFLYHYIFYEG